MENKTPNHSIQCTVKQCEHHSNDVNFCTLNSVRIATHEANPTQCQCVDCESFQKRCDSGCSDGTCRA